jgi:hypothetical protein
MSTDSTSHEQCLDELVTADDDGSLSSSGPETAAPGSGLRLQILKDLFKSPEIPGLSPNSASRRDCRSQDGIFYQKLPEISRIQIDSWGVA